MISAAGSAHAAALAAIHEQAFPHDPWDETAFLTLLSQPGVHAFIDDAGGMILIRCVADEAEILTIGVAPDAARRGIGTALLRAATDAARAGGIRTLFLEVASGNFAAMALYAKAGFAQVGVRRDYYGQGQNALVLRAAL